MAVLAVISLLVALVALVVAAYAVRQVRGRRPVPGDADSLPRDVLGLRQEVAALQAEAAGALRHLGVVRYDAFGDLGGRLSWSLALLDDAGDGILLTAIHGRTEARSYAKSIGAWTCEQPLSPEEQDAVSSARAG